MGKPVVIPQFGVIKGGRLDSWYFHFLRFDVAEDGIRLLIWARCTPPAWPIPCDIALAPRHFMQLRAVRGSRAKRLPALPLVRTAFRLAELILPDWMESWLTGEVRMTMRAAVKRSGVRPRIAR